MNHTDRIFLEFSVRKLELLTERIGKCLDRLTEEQIWARGGENENAVANLAMHLAGNLGQWIVASVGGRPDVRQRDAEFGTRGGLPVSELKERLRAAVAEATTVIKEVTSERLTEVVKIQKNEMPVMEVIYHVVEHFSMHAGQIMFATKMLTSADLGFYAHLNKAAVQGQKTH